MRLLLRLQRADGRQLWSRELEGEETTGAATVPDVVARMGSVLGQLLAEARSDLERALAAR